MDEVLVNDRNRSIVILAGVYAERQNMLDYNQSILIKLFDSIRSIFAILPKDQLR